MLSSGGRIFVITFPAPGQGGLQYNAALVGIPAELGGGALRIHVAELQELYLSAVSVPSRLAQ